MFSVKDGSFNSFENGTVKLLAKETKWALLEVRTQHTFLENLISKYDFGPVKLPGLSRNGPQPGSCNQALTQLSKHDLDACIDKPYMAKKI